MHAEWRRGNWNFDKKKKVDRGTLEIKYNFRNLIAHLQNISNHIPEYYLSILWNEDRGLVTTTSPKTSFPLNWPPGSNMKILKPYCAYATDRQTDKFPN